MSAANDAAEDGSLYATARRAGGALLAALSTRLELALLELDEAGGRLLGIALLGLLGVLLLAGALLGLAAALVIHWWPQHGLGALVGVGLALAVVGVALLLAMRRALHRRPPLLEASLHELQRDAALMQGTRFTEPAPRPAARGAAAAPRR